MAAKAGHEGDAPMALTDCDLVGLESALRVCDLDIVLLDGSALRANIRARVQDRSLACTAISGFRFHGRFELPADWCVLGFLHAASSKRSWCHGAPLSSEMAIAVLPDGGVSEFALDAGADLTVLVLPVQRLHAKYGELSLSSTSAPPGLLGPFYARGPRAESMRLGYERLRAVLRSDAPLCDGDIERLVEMHIQAALSVGHVDRPAYPRGQRAHYSAFQRAEAYMRSNMQHDIYMDDICEAIGVSERTLRHAFKSLLGVSPNRYLAMLRLCAACRSLSATGTEERSVKSVALSCGLWDLSRFAENYRRVFGELPSDTLHRRRAMPQPHRAGSQASGWKAARRSGLPSDLI